LGSPTGKSVGFTGVGIWAEHTKLINRNKIEAIFFIISRYANGLKKYEQ